MNGNLVIKASAGTGKTFAIATRYLQLLVFDGVEPGRILALTFSRAAAQEIYDKILERLWLASGAGVATENRSATEIEAARRKAAAEEAEHLLEGLPPERRKEARAKVAGRDATFFAGLLRRVLDAQHLDAIATLDSFIQRIVRSFPLEMGFQRELSVLDRYGEKRAADGAVAEILSASRRDRDAIRRDFLATQKAQTVRACLPKIRKILPPLLPFLREHPEAGTWTEDSMRRALGIDEALRKPDLSVLRVDGPQGTKFVEDIRKWVGGYDGSSDVFPKNKIGEILRFFHERPEATAMEGLTLRNRQVPFDCGAKGAAAIRAAVGYLAAVALNARLGATAAKLRLASAAAEAYDRAGRGTGRLSFDDFTRSQARAAMDENGRVCLRNLQFRLDSRFDHWALDEFQDTSMAQWDCLRALVKEAAGSVMAVGDFKQSIYGWRGGNDRPFEDLIAYVEGGGGRIESLDLSHRYGKNTAEFVNAVFGPENVAGFADGACPGGVRLWRDVCWPEKGHQAKGEGDYVEIAVPGENGGTAVKDDGGSGEKNDEDEAARPSRSMRDLAPTLCDFVREFWERHEAAGSAETVGILVRNNADGLYLAERLRKLDRDGKPPLPVVWEGKGGVLDCVAVRAVLELLRLAEHPEDRFSREVVETLFPVRRTVFPDAEFGDGASAEAVSEKVAELLSRLGLARTLRKIVGALKDAKDGNGRPALDRRSRMRLDDLVREGVRFEERPDAIGGIGAFHEYLETVSDRETAASPDVIRILTIHRSKGLSIDHVVVPVVEDGNILGPKPKSPLFGEGWFLESLPEETALANKTTRAAWKEASDGRLLETLRTWYVALTRARKSTFVFVARRKSGDSGKEARASEGRGIGDLLLRPFAGSTLQTCGSRSVLHAVGAPPVFARRESEKDGSAADAAPPAARTAWTHGGVRSRVRHGTPSSEGASGHRGVRTEVSRWFAAGDVTRGSAARRGLDEHAAYAAIEWIDPAAPKDEREKEILRRGGAWSEAFARTAGATVWRERGYERIVGNGAEEVWETGQFDRVVFRDGEDGPRADLYDFKTNRRWKGESVAKFEERMRSEYAGQMASYRDALASLCGLPADRIRTTLLLADTGTAREA